MSNDSFLPVPSQQKVQPMKKKPDASNAEPTQLELDTATILTRLQQEKQFRTTGENAAFSSGFNECLHWIVRQLPSVPIDSGTMTTEQRARLYLRYKDEEMKEPTCGDGTGKRDSRKIAADRAGFGSHWAGSTSAKIVGVIDSLEAAGDHKQAAELRRVLESETTAEAFRVAKTIRPELR